MLYHTIELEEFELRWPDAKSKQVLMTAYGDAVFWLENSTNFLLTELRLDNGITQGDEPLVLRWKDFPDGDANGWLWTLFHMFENQLLADESIVEQLVLAYREVA